MRKTTLKICFGILLVGGLYAAVIKIFDVMIPCFYYTNYGIECPGCGVTRMFLSMMRFDFKAAFGYNPVLFILFFVWLAVAVLCIWDKFEFVRKKGFMRTMLVISLTVSGIYGILRNFY